MSKQSILALGINLPPCEGFEPVDFTDKRSLLDADIIVAQPSWSGFELSYNDGFQGRHTLDEDSSRVFREMKPHWSREYGEALEAGKGIIFFLSEHHERNFYTGTYESSGTGRNTRKTVHVNRCSDYDFVPIPPIRLGFGSGKSMKLSQAGKVLQSFWAKYSEHMAYHAFMTGVRGDVVVSTTTGNRALGLLQRHPSSGGYALYLPELDFSYLGREVAEDNERWAEAYVQFCLSFRKDIIDLDRAIKSDVEKESSPDWANQEAYALESESSLLKDLDDIARESEVLAERRLVAAEALDKELGWKALLNGSGKELERVVREALVLIGYVVSTVDDGTSEFDVVFEADGRRFIGEVEGKDTKPISIDKASQLHRNLAEDFSRDDIASMATGVLFGNGERLIDPSERSETFTLKVKTFAATTNLTLVNTVDLYGLVQAIKLGASDDYKASCREAIAASSGALAKFPVSKEE